MYEVENSVYEKQLATDVYRKETASVRMNGWLLAFFVKEGFHPFWGYINQTAAQWVYNPRISSVVFAAVLRSRFVSERERLRERK